MRYFIEIAYCGKNYCGWQNQPNAVSVQETIEGTFSTLLQRKTTIVGAGRTDAGVHAKQIFAHIDLDEKEVPENMVYKLNALLPNDIVIYDFFCVNEDAHTRFDALSRTYQYKMMVGKNPFLEDFAYRIHTKPDVKKMNEAAKILFKYTDFQCFSKTKTDVKTFNCVITKAFWEETENQLIFTIAADRFLRNMVRAIVGTLLDIGFHKIAIEEMHTIIKSKNRSNAGTSVPAHGLYLTQVEYPENIKTNG